MNAADIREKKRLLRKEIKERIKALDEDYCRWSDEKISSAVVTLPQFVQANTVFCFVGTGGEPDTRTIILKALEMGKTVGVPKCLSDSVMEVRKIYSLDDLEEGMYGIFEPKEGLQVIEPEAIDFSLIPCVTCDFNGNRLGHGKGYYDRYLENGKFFTCMVCRGKLMSTDIPMDKFDVKPDMVISDTEAIEN